MPPKFRVLPAAGMGFLFSSVFKKDHSCRVAPPKWNENSPATTPGTTPANP
jgi:hypothetical protein